MTTYVFFDGLLAADTCISRSTNGVVHEVGRINKIRANPAFAVVGTGRSRVVFFLSLLPNLLALRWLGWAVVPNAATYENGEFTVVYVVWRNGMVWNFATRLERRWGFLFAKRVGATLDNAHAPHHNHPSVLANDDGASVAASLRVGPHFVSKGGSGGRQITLKDVARLGCVGAIALAAMRDPGTNTQATVFDTRRWAFQGPLHAFAPVPGTVLSVLLYRWHGLCSKLAFSKP